MFAILHYISLEISRKRLGWEYTLSTETRRACKTGRRNVISLNRLLSPSYPPTNNVYIFVTGMYMGIQGRV